jgi:integrase/recombinase XerC/integrase/recombinase XerD
MKKRYLRWEQMDKSQITLDKLLGMYDIYNRSEGKSPKTLRFYDQNIRGLINWLLANNRSIALGDIDETLIREHILDFQEGKWRNRPLSPSTVNDQNGYTETHLLQKVKPPKIPYTLIEILTDNEIDQIFASLDTKTMAGSRSTAMMDLLLDVGTRLFELTNLQEENVHIQKQYIKVLGKGGKERIVAFGNVTRRALLNYQIHFRPEPAYSGITQFFLTHDGYPLSEEAVKSQIRRIAKTSGVPRLHAHLCRHTYATNFLLNGGNVLLLKQNLGHTTLAMVDRYVHLATSKIAVMSQDFSPLDRRHAHHARKRNGNSNNVFDGNAKIFSRNNGKRNNGK